jgi:hypothetical protein
MTVLISQPMTFEEYLILNAGLMRAIALFSNKSLIRPVDKGERGNLGNRNP